MSQVLDNLFSKFDINAFSRFLQPEHVEYCYREDLKENNKRTRSDHKICCYNMVLLVLLWVLNPEDGYASILDKVKGVFLKATNNIQAISEAITGAGLCKARKRFSSQILQRIWQLQVIGTYYKEKAVKLWKGFRVCAADGTTLTLNKSENILSKYPILTKSSLPKILMSVLYDVYSKIPLDVEFANFPGDERGVLYKLIDRIKYTNVLLLLDRGYPAYWLLHKMINSKIHFVMRIPSYFKYKPVKRLGHNDWIIKLYLNKDNKRRSKKYLSLVEYNSLPNEITIRLVKTHMKGFRPRYLFTSLVNEKEYSYAEICKLYCDRWIIENYYRDLKHILKIEKFHAKYVDGIYQEIYAAMILTIILQQYIVKSATRHYVNFYEISFKRAFKIINHFLFLLEMLPEINNSIEDLMLLLIASNKQKIRPGRSYKRVFYRKIKSNSKSRQF